MGATSGNKVYVDSPRNVEVYLDGNYLGLSPVSFGKTVGSHTITLRKSGYKTRSYTIYLYNDGKDTTYSFSDLEQETVSGNSTKPNDDNSLSGNSTKNSRVTVHIEEPEGVEVYVRNENDEKDVHIGTSPISFEREEGTYIVTFRKDGYKTQSYTFYLKSERPDVTYRLDDLKEDSGHEHDYTEEITKDPTCTEDGKKTYTCDCGESYTEAISAKGHHFDENGKCTECGADAEDPDNENGSGEGGSTGTEGGTGDENNSGDGGNLGNEGSSDDPHDLGNNENSTVKPEGTIEPSPKTDNEGKSNSNTPTNIAMDSAITTQRIVQNSSSQRKR